MLSIIIYKITKEACQQRLQYLCMQSCSKSVSMYFALIKCLFNGTYFVTLDWFKLHKQGLYQIHMYNELYCVCMHVVKPGAPKAGARLVS